MKLRRGLFAITPFIFLCGCAAPSNEGRVRGRMLETAQKSGSNAVVWEQRFIGCVTGYAKEHASADATPSEIAEAAASRCQSEMDAFIGSMRIYYEESDGATTRSLNEYALVKQQAIAKSENEGTDLATRGKQKAIATIIDLKAMSRKP